MSAENVLKQLGKVKYVVATNPKGGRHNVEIVHYSINGTKGNYG